MELNAVLQSRMDESWSNISKLFEKSTNAEQDLIKSVFEYAFRAGYNTGYARGLTDDIIHMVGGNTHDTNSN